MGVNAMGQAGRIRKLCKHIAPHSTSGPTAGLKIMSYNVYQLNESFETNAQRRIEQWLANMHPTSQPDVLCTQEDPQDHDMRPKGYEAVVVGGCGSGNHSKVNIYVKSAIRGEVTDVRRIEVEAGNFGE